MAVTLQCPDNATLLRLFGQGGSREEMDSLAQHVEQCTGCGERIDKMLRKDELSLGLARPVDGTDMPDSEALINLRRRLQQLRIPASSEKTADAVGVHSTSASSSPFPATLPMSGSDHGITFLAPPQQPDEIGRLGPYRVLKKLGAGGMGMVLLAEDAMLKRKVALKVMLPNIAVNPQARERFLREARAAAAIEHAHIIAIHQVGEDNGVPFLAMPLLKGESLDDRLRREKKLPINEAVRITCEMADGLAAAHAQGLIHRDIKPANVWLEEQPLRAPAAGAQAARRPAKVKVLDFGLARSQTDEIHLTQSGAIVGTPAFMAPEQARGLQVDARADLFSLGCVLYVMLTGKRPFTGESTMALLTALALDTPKAPGDINPAVPAALSDFTMRLLAKKPERRPASADAALDELRGIIRAAAAAKKAAPPSPHLAATKTAIQPPSRLPAPRPAPAAVRLPRRRIALFVGLALVFVIGGGFAAYQLIFKTNDGTLIVDVDAAADVRFQKGELHIMGDDGKLKYTLKASERNKTLPPGKYLVEVSGADGLKVVTDKFEITRNGNATVHVTVAAEKKDDAVVATKPTVDDAWIKQVRALPADKQVEAVAAKMKERNPGFDGKMTPTIGRGVVIAMEFITDEVTDISPLQALPGLGSLTCAGTKDKSGRLSDLSPLRDMKLTYLGCFFTRVSDLSPLKGMNLGHLFCYGTRVSDLSPLKGMKLQRLGCGDTAVADLSPLRGMPLSVVGCENTPVSDLSPLNGMNLTDLCCYNTRISSLPSLKGMNLASLNCGQTQVSDLSPLKGMPLTFFLCWDTEVSDLSPLKGMPLTRLEIPATRVTDLSILKGMPLKELSCDFNAKRDADILRSIKTLETINQKPAAEFWKEVDAAAKAPAKKDADPERRAAEWVLSVGGDGTLRVNDHGRPFNRELGLPEDKFFVTSVGFWDNNQVTADGLKNLTGLTQIERLEIRGALELGKATEVIGSLTTLRYLLLSGMHLTDKEFKPLRKLSNLNSLGLFWTPMTDASLDDFEQLTSLSSLMIGETSIPMAKLAQLKNIKILERLGFHGISDADLVQFKNMPRLTHLEIYESGMTGRGLASLKTMPILSHLTLHDGYVSDADLDQVIPIKQLTEIDIKNTNITAAGAKKLAVALPKCKITWEGSVIEPKQ